MSVFAKETAVAVAETAGIVLQDDVASVLVQDVEYRLRDVIGEATKFMRRARRTTLLPEDINAALRIRGVEPLYGWIPGRSTLFLSATQASQTVYFLEDEEVDLDEIMNEPLPPVPRPTAYTVHWLAVEGVQPAIPENPNPAELEAATLRTVYNSAAGGLVGATPPTKGPVRSTRNGKGDATTAGGTVSTSDAERGRGATSDILVKTVLTKELQIYYEKVTEALMSNVEELQDLAVESVCSDASIPALLPYLIQFIAEHLSSNIRSLSSNTALMRLARALLSNPNLFVEPYLHQMIPSILTCVVAKRLCAHPAVEPHWDLRDFSAKLVVFICKRFNASYGNLQPRITKTYLRALLDPLKAITTNYGALSGIYELGPETAKVIIVPNVAALAKRFQDNIEQATQELARLEGSKSKSENDDPTSGKDGDLSPISHAKLLIKGSKKCLSKLSDILRMVHLENKITWE